MPIAPAGSRVTSAVLDSYYNLSDASLFNIGSAVALTQISNDYVITTGEPIVGSTYRLRAWGNGTQGSTAQTAEFAVSFGGVTTGTGMQIASGFAPTSTAFRWWMEAEAMCISIGSAATWQVGITGLCGSGSGVQQNASPITVSTLAPIPFFIQGEWLSATGAPTMAGLRSVLERLL